jgi:uncharacterized membrane protein
MRFHLFAKQLQWIFVVPVLLFVFLFSLDGVNRYTIRRDELTTLGHIGALEENPTRIPLANTLQSLAQYSPEHPPLYYFLMNLFGSWMDFNYFVLRMVSVWFSMIAVAMLYWIGTRLANHQTGIFAMILNGSNVIVYSITHEMRPWTMLLMLALLIWGSYWQLAHTSKSIRWYQLFTLLILIVSALYTNYLIMFLLIPLGLYHLLFRPKDKRWTQITATVVFAGICFIPWLPVFANSIGDKQIQQAEHLETASVMIENFDLIPLFRLFQENNSS